MAELITLDSAMHLPTDNNLNDDAADADRLGRFRPYLLMLARLQFDEALQAKIDASDIVQQTLLEAHQGLADFRGQTKREVAAWLRRILARNLADELRRFRSLKRNVQLEASLQGAIHESTLRVEKWIADEEASPSECAMANERLVILAAAIAQLPDDQRRAVDLHHLQGLPSALVAVRMGRTEVAIAGLLRRGLKNLRELLGDVH